MLVCLRRVAEKVEKVEKAMRVVRKEVFQSTSSTEDDELLGSGDEDRANCDIWFCVFGFRFCLINWMDVGATH